MTLISKYNFVSSSQSLSYSCHAQPVSKGFSGILNEFMLSDFVKFESWISACVAGSFVWHNFFLTQSLYNVRCSWYLLLSCSLLISLVFSPVASSSLLLLIFLDLLLIFLFLQHVQCIRLPRHQCNNIILYAHTTMIVGTLFNGKNITWYRYRMCAKLHRIPQSWLHDR